MVALATYNKKNSRIRQDLPPLVGELATDPTPVRRTQRRLDEAEVAALTQARQDGVQIKELAAQFKIHKSTVIAHLERAGVPGKRWQGKTLNPRQVKDAAWLYESGLSLIEVGERFGVDRRQVSRAFKEAGVSLRPPGRRSQA